MAPLVMRLTKAGGVAARLCITAQHREMFDKVLNLFDLEPDYDLNIMKPNKTPGKVVSAALNELDSVLADFRPDFVLAHEASIRFAYSHQRKGPSKFWECK